eukprot:104566_1
MATLKITLLKTIDDAISFINNYTDDETKTNATKIHFSKENCGKGLKFISDSIIKKIGEDKTPSLCCLNETISNTMCQTATITFILTGTVYAMFGYIISDKLASMNLNERLGYEKNKKLSLGFLVNSGWKENAVFYLYNHEKQGHNMRFNYRATEPFKSGDTFTLKFNFKRHTVYCWHNDNSSYYAAWPFHGNYKQDVSVIPCVSLNAIDTQIEIASIQYKNDK